MGSGEDNRLQSGSCMNTKALGYHSSARTWQPAHMGLCSPLLLQQHPSRSLSDGGSFLQPMSAESLSCVPGGAVRHSSGTRRLPLGCAGRQVALVRAGRQALGEAALPGPGLSAEPGLI